MFVFLLGALAAGCAGCEPSTNPKGDPVTPTTATASTESSTTPPASSSSPDGGAHTKTIFVREVLADCEGEGPTKCMQVRDSEKEDWHLFYGAIDGFTYEESYVYELRVRREHVKNPPADAPSRKLHLVEVVSKKKPAK